MVLLRVCSRPGPCVLASRAPSCTLSSNEDLPRRGTLLGGGVSDVEEEYGGATGLRDRGVPPACQLLAKRLSNEEIDS